MALVFRSILLAGSLLRSLSLLVFGKVELERTQAPTRELDREVSALKIVVEVMKGQHEALLQDVPANAHVLAEEGRAFEAAAQDLDPAPLTPREWAFRAPRGGQLMIPAV